MPLLPTFAQVFARMNDANQPTKRLLENLVRIPLNVTISRTASMALVAALEPIANPTHWTSLHGVNQVSTCQRASSQPPLMSLHTFSQESATITSALANWQSEGRASLALRIWNALSKEFIAALAESVVAKGHGVSDLPVADTTNAGQVSAETFSSA